jgi:type IV pilus assembly protein PilA
MQTKRKLRNNAGFSLIELLVVVGLILVITAIAIPSLMAAKRSSNGSAAASSVDGYNKAVVSYSNEWNVPAPAVAVNMWGSEVNPPALSATEGGEITKTEGTALDTATGLQKSGYLFSFKSSTPNGTAPAVIGSSGITGNTNYDIVATPVTPNQTGVANYCMDATGEYEQIPTGTTTQVFADGVSCSNLGFSERLGS